MQLTVYYDGQFWVGVFEELVKGELLAARHVFGSEPSCHEILMFVQEADFSLLFNQYRLPVSVCDLNQKRTGANPKRLAREAARVLSERGTSTKSQEAIKKQMAAGKAEARKLSREEREAERVRRREIARSKALKRHRGH
jgi:Protein of unknown function (DUF2992)